MIASGDQQIAQRATLKLLIAAIFVVSIDSRVITPILPAIADDLGVTIGRAGLIVTAYLLPYGLFQLFYGPLADRKATSGLSASRFSASRSARRSAHCRPASPRSSAFAC